MLTKPLGRATRRRHRVDPHIAIMGDFTASVAHEVNQPLMAMVTNADTCLRWLAGDRPNIEEARRAAERIVRDGHRAGEIVKSMRTLAQNGVPEAAATDVNAAITDTLAMVQSDLCQFGVTARTILAPDLPCALTDAIQLQQLLVNLIRNAIEAMAALPEGVGLLTISTGCDARGDIAVAVSDTGSGIDPALSELIFEALFTTKPGRGRTGARGLPHHRHGPWRPALGLRERTAWKRAALYASRCRGSGERRSKVCNNNPGRHSTGCSAARPRRGWIMHGLEMLTGYAAPVGFGRPPVMADALAAWHDRSDPGVVRGRTDASLDTPQPTIFIIDDDLGIREALEGLFRSMGLRAETFASASAFLDRAHEDLVGCIVLDIRLPGRSGLDFQDDLASANLRLPVIFITGHADIRMSVRAMKAGAVEFLTKPVRQQDLLDAIQVAMARDAVRWQANHAETELRAAFASLTSRERDAMMMIVSGRQNKQIAFEMGICESTVKLHRGRVMSKMRVRSVAELVRLVHRLGLGHNRGTDPHPPRRPRSDRSHQTTRLSLELSGCRLRRAASWDDAVFLGS